MRMRNIDNIYIKRFFYFNVFIIKGQDGDILIDTGFIGIKRRLKRYLNQFNIKLVILTHAHVDHIWNAAYIKELYNCKIAMGKLDIKNIDNKRINSKAYHNKYKLWTKLMNLGMRKFEVTPFKVDYKLKDGDTINKYGIKLKIISLPGHTDGSIGIIYKDYLFCGDALVNRKRKKVEVAYQNQDNGLADKSVLKIYIIKPNLIFMGHDREAKLEKLNNLIECFEK